MKNIFPRLKSRAGQHIAEFMVLFLAVCIAFVGTRLYLRRGVNAKLKLVEDRINEAMGKPTIYITISSTDPATLGKVVYSAGWDMTKYNPPDCNKNCAAPRYAERKCLVFSAQGGLGGINMYALDQLCYWYGICLCCGSKNYGPYSLDVIPTGGSSERPGHLDLLIYGCQDNPSTGVCGFMYDKPCGS